MSEGERVAHGGFDIDAEEVADAADVAAGGVDLLEDAGADLRPGGVLEDLQEPQGTDHVIGLAFGPPVLGCMVTDNPSAVTDQVALGVPGPLTDHGRVRAQFEQC